MPLGRGERIGEAYVRILLDGEGMKDDIIDQLEGDEADIQQIGERDSAAYIRGWDKQFRREGGKEMSQSLDDALGVGAGRMDAIAQQVARLYESRLRERLGERFGDSKIGDRIFEKIVARFSETGSFAGLERDLVNLRALSIEVTQDIMREEDKAHRDRIRAANELARTRTKQGREYIANLKEMQAHFDDILKGQRASREELAAAAVALDKLVGEADRYKDLMGSRANQDMLRDLEQMRRGLITATPAMDRFNHRMDTMIPLLSRAFGKGSRNNFLNFFGSMTGNLLRIIPLLVSVGSGAIGMARLFRSGAATADGLFASLRAGLSAVVGVGGGFGKLAVTVGATVASLVATVAVIGTVVAAFSLLAGVVTALAASLTFGLVAALSSLLAVLLPLGAALGVIGLAFIGMDDKAKKLLKETLKPLSDAFKELGERARAGLFARLPETVSNLTRVFRGLGPLVEGVGRSISKVVFDWSERMDTKGFREWRDEVADFLISRNGIPGAVEKLGVALGNFASGLGGLFRGMIPFMNRTLDYLVKITDEFANWANTKQGREEIEAFFERAGDSLKSVWGFLKAVGSLLGTIFTAGQASGDTIFDRMAGQLREWNDALEKNPEILDKWFRDAEGFATALGHLIQNVGKLIDVLDNDFTRALATGLIEGLSLLFDVLSSLNDITGGGLGKALGYVVAGIAGLAIASKVVKGVTLLVGAMRALRGVAAVTLGIQVASGAAGAGGLAGGAAAGAGIGAAIRKGLSSAGFKTLLKAGAVVAVIDLAVRAAQGISGEGSGGLFGEIKSEWAVLKGIISDPLDFTVNDKDQSLRELGIKIKDIFTGPKKIEMNAEEVKAADRATAILKEKLDHITPGGRTGRFIRMNSEEVKAATDAVVALRENFINKVPFLTGARVKMDAKEIEAADKAVKALREAIPNLPFGDVKIKKDEVDIAKQTTDNLRNTLLAGLPPAAVKMNAEEVKAADTALKGLRNLTGNLPGGKVRMDKTEVDIAKQVTDNLRNNLLQSLPGKITMNKQQIDDADRALKALRGLVTTLPGGKAKMDGKEVKATENQVKALERAMKGLPPKTIKMNKKEVEAADKATDELHRILKLVDRNFNPKVSTSSINAAKRAAQGLADILNSLPGISGFASGGIIGGGESLASGGLANFAQKYGRYTIGEAGPEAIVPLNRPLGMVNPTVRDLSAYAQGKSVNSNNNKTIDASGWTIVTPTQDPHAVAVEALNELTGRLL